MSSRINEFRAAVPPVIKAAMPELRTCVAQLGRFDLDRLDTTSLRMQAVLVGVISAPLSSNPNDSSSATLEVIAFAVTEGREEERDNAAWAIGEAIAAILRRPQRWGLTNIAEPESVKLTPIISEGIAKRGVSILSCGWRQRLNGIGEAIFEAGVLPAEAYLNDEPVDIETVFEEES